MKLKKATYDQVMSMPDRMIIRHGEQAVMIVGIGAMRRKRLTMDWKEVRRCDGIIRYEKTMLSWTEGTLHCCLLRESERDYAMKVLRMVLSDNYGVVDETLVREVSPETDDNVLYLRERADEGNMGALFRLAGILFAGDGQMKRDYGLARELYRQVWQLYKNRQCEHYWYTRYLAAMSRNQLGFICEHGLGVEPDPEAAFFHYRWAARRDIPMAMLNLGLMQVSPCCAHQHTGEGIRWLEMACRRGVLQAPECLRRVRERLALAES